MPFWAMTSDLVAKFLPVTRSCACVFGNEKNNKKKLNKSVVKCRIKKTEKYIKDWVTFVFQIYYCSKV
ncbi:hypothetical protein M23134_03567 [Microscilla marina ATCC 23134]|uniref:Uncharacterized protein n=1 Tax=Microscilla marina ATCC 23134 TaxID=313606 RepID=A1ZRL0_MICM2|nr:hypothetical protein M23134_03567 [Microscilla marina ATCC 23134]